MNVSQGEGVQAKKVNPSVNTKTINLTAGLNLIPILSTTPVNAETLFNGVAGFVMIKDVAGSAIYWPVKNINTIGDLMPGKSYFIEMNAPGMVAFD